MTVHSRSNIIVQNGMGEIHVRDCAGYPVWKQAKPTNSIRLYRGAAIGV